MNNDLKLQQDVLAELRWEPAVPAAHIGVSAKDGVVTLSGHVNNFWSKLEAENAARRVQGVKVVAEQIEVQLPDDHKLNDDDIGLAIAQRLGDNAAVPPNAIKATVEKGRVTLSGEVSWHFEKEAAADEIRYLRGVAGVVNMIQIKKRVSTINIKEDITSALKRSWYTRPDLITVNADGGAVTLSGFVHSPHARSVAALTAWAAPGATKVVNNLAIT